MRIVIETKGKTSAEMAANVAKLLAHLLEDGDGTVVPGDFGSFSFGSFSIKDDPKQKQEG